MAHTTQQPFQTTYSIQLPFPAQTAYTTQQAFPSQPSFPVQAQFVPQASYPTQAFPFGLPSEPPKALAMETGECPSPPPLPPLDCLSGCSSPLQLNLLQLEDNMAPPSGAVQQHCTAVFSL
jgi:hypothetical protein